MSSNQGHQQQVNKQPNGNMQALVTDGNKSATVKSIAIPVPGEGEILVKTNWIAQNPTDWKGMGQASAGLIVGCDFAGLIANANGSQWREGQRVAGFVQGNSTNPQRGAFAEYLVIESSLVFAIPDAVKDQEAAVIPLAFATATQAMFQRLRLPEPSKPSKNAEPFLVNGGTSSVGKYAVQLGKAAGLFVIATGAKKNHHLLTQLGADACVDYHDEGWEEQVRNLSHDRVEYAFDCISGNGTVEKLAQCLSSTKGGHIICLLAQSDEVKAKVDKKVKVESTIVYTVFERAIKYFTFDNCGEATPADRAFWEKYLGLLPEFLTSGTIKPNRQEERGGFDAILEGFKDQREGKISARKLVYHLSS